jgi:hypothetical protein
MEKEMNPYLKDMMNYVGKLVVSAPVGYDEVKVVIDPTSKVLEAYVEELYFNIQTSVSLTGGNFGVTEEEFILYCHTLVKYRVDYVCSGRGKSVKVPFGPTERIVVPSYLSCVLQNIGRAVHAEFGLEFMPEMKEGLKYLEPDEMRRISNSLKLLKGIGLEYAEGYSRNKDGSLDFMTMSLMDGMVRNISKDPHPVYALLSSTLGVRGVETVLSPRITYGNVDHLTSLVRGLAALKV